MVIPNTSQQVMIQRLNIQVLPITGEGGKIKMNSKKSKY